MSSQIVLVTGSNGLLGTAIKEIVGKQENKFEFRFVNREDADLSDYHTLKKVFYRFKPSYVIHLASYFPGFYDRLKKQTNIIMKNFKINQNVSKACLKFSVQKCIMCFSAAVFPYDRDFPMPESALEAGPPHPTDIGYAHAARASIALNKCYRESGCIVQFIHVVLCNLYGPNDNFNLISGHVLPALIHKAFLSSYNECQFRISGTGETYRQFMYNQDAGLLLIKVLEEYNDNEPLIISVDPSDQISINSLAEKIIFYGHYNIEVINDTMLEEGPTKRTLNNAKLKSLWPDFKFTPLDEGIKLTIKWFEDNMKSSENNKLVSLKVKN